MHINVEENRDIAYIYLEGRFDSSRHRMLISACENNLNKQEIEKLEINISGVEYFDSSAFGTLLLIRELATQNGKSLQLSNPKGGLLRAIERGNFHRVFTIVHSDIELLR